MKVVLESVVFLNWRSAYDDQAKSQAHINIQHNLPVTHDEFMGRGKYVNPVTQAQIAQQAYFL